MVISNWDDFINEDFEDSIELKFRFEKEDFKQILSYLFDDNILDDDFLLFEKSFLYQERGQTLLTKLNVPSAWFKPSEHELTPCYHIMVRMQDTGSEINYSNGPVGRVFYFEKIDIFKKLFEGLSDINNWAKTQNLKLIHSIGGTTYVVLNLLFIEN